MLVIGSILISMRIGKKNPKKRNLEEGCFFLVLSPVLYIGPINRCGPVSARLIKVAKDNVKMGNISGPRVASLSHHSSSS